MEGVSIGETRYSRAVIRLVAKSYFSQKNNKSTTYIVWWVDLLRMTDCVEANLMLLLYAPTVVITYASPIFGSVRWQC